MQGKLPVLLVHENEQGPSMYLSEFWASCRRRWYLVVVLIVASTALCWMAAGKIQPSYDAKASLVLIPPRTPDDPDANRYLDLGSLSNSVDVLSRSMISEDTAKLLEKAAPGAEYDVSHDLTTSAPIVLVSVSSKERASAAAMLDAVIGQIPRDLTQLQDEIGVKPQFRITALVVSQDSKPIPNQKTRARLLGVLVVALLFGSAVLIAVVDGLLLRRSRRAERIARESREAGESEDPEPAEGPVHRQRPTTTTAPPDDPRRRDVKVTGRPGAAAKKARGGRKGKEQRARPDRSGGASGTNGSDRSDRSDGPGVAKRGDEREPAR